MTAQAVNWGDPRLPERFWNAVSPCPLTSCWHWNGPWISGGKHESGAKFALNGAWVSVRHLAYRSLVGPIEPRRRLGSRCSFGCCNPAHLVITPRWTLDQSIERRRQQVAKSRDAFLQRNPAFRFEYYLKNTYGLTVEQYAEMLERQDGRCAICRTAFENRKKQGPHVDHCHSSGRVRALLCGGCNSGLGFFKDSREALRAAIKYLDDHESSEAS